MSEHVRIEREGAVMAVTLDRPERRNAITAEMYAALADALETAASDEFVRIIVFRGEGQDYCAGNDLGDFLQAAQRSIDDIPVWRFLRALAQCEAVLVAAVHGNCVGIGTTMLLHFDLVAADEGARFALPFVDLALVPEAASSLLLPRLAGPRRAARYLLLGEPFGAREALDIGLVSHVTEPGSLDEKLSHMVGALLAKPPEALRQTRALLHAGQSAEILERMRLESEVFSERLGSAEARELFAAFFEKRKPDFSSLT
jgi:enoyl-CoA hydratase/carnithine racemase